MEPDTTVAKTEWIFETCNSKGLMHTCLDVLISAVIEVLCGTV